MQTLAIGAGAVQGYYNVLIHKADINGEIIPNTTEELTGWFPNLITDNGLNLIMTTDSWLACCKVGSGTTAPAVSDIHIETFVAGTGNIVSTETTVRPIEPYYVSRINKYRFMPGEITGEISEVCISPTAGDNDDIVSRSLILNGSGTPISRYILADDIVDVLYEFRYAPNITVGGGTTVINGTSHTWEFKPANIATPDNGYNFGWGIEQYGTAVAPPYNVDVLLSNESLALITGMPTGVSGGVGIIASPYVDDSYAATLNISIHTYSGNNLGGIKSIVAKLGIGVYQIEFTPAIPKTFDTKVELTIDYSITRA